MKKYYDLLWIIIIIIIMVIIMKNAQNMIFNF